MTASLRLIIGRVALPLVLLGVLFVAPGGRSAESDDPAANAMAEGERLFWLDNWLKARESFATAESLYTARGDQRNALYATLSRLRAEADRVGYPGISAYLSEQLGSPLVQRDGRLRLRCLVIKAAIDLSIDPSSSATTWADALKLAQELGEKGWAERAQSELAVIAFLEGRTSDAQALLTKSITTATLLGDVAGQVRGLSLAAVGLLELGDYERALRYADQALSLAARKPDLRFPLMAHMAKASALDGLGRASEAREFLDRALAFVNVSNMSVYKADVLIALGERAAKADRREEAIRDFEEAVESAKAVGMPRPQAAALFHLSRLYLKSGDPQAAEDRVMAGLSASRELVDMYVLPQHLASAAEIKRSVGKTGEADAYYSEAADLVEAMLVNVPSPTLRATLISAMSRIYVGQFQLAVEHFRDLRKAFYVVERARGRVAADELRAPSFDRSRPSPAVATAERAITQIQIRLQRAKSPSLRKALLHELFLAEEKLGPALLERQRIRKFEESEPVSLPALRAVLRPDELLIEYVLGEPNSYALAISTRSLRAHKLPSAATISGLVNRVRREVRANQDPLFADSGRLYAALLGSIPEATSHRRVIIVPDGSLHLLPFDILQTEPGRYFGDDHVVSFTLSGTVLQLLRKSSVQRPGSDRVLAVGWAGTPAGSKPGNVSAPASETRGVFDAAGADLGALPATAEEVHFVARWGGPTTAVLDGADATEANFKAQRLDGFGVLHLALHGVADTKFPDRSALVFRSDPEGNEDGLLQVREIRALRLRTQLVTLSACDTGLGRIEGQEGMASIVRAFLFAGARNVAAALWDVDDVSTTALMKRFYTRLADGIEVPEALQMAKVDLRRDLGRMAKVYHWGGFVMVGDGRMSVRFGRPDPRKGSATRIH